jgi:hypothetical protein
MMEGECGTYGGRRGVYRVLLGKTGGERGYLEELDEDMMITVKWFFKKYDVAAWSGLIWLKTRTTESSFEHGNESLRPINCGICD